MSVVINALLSLFLVPFWAAVLAFCPIMFFLILHPLYSIRAESAAKKNIFLLREESALKQEKANRMRGVRTIYVACFCLAVIVGVINWMEKGSFGVQPFDVLSTMSVVLFCFAVITYFPFAAYLLIKDPWKYKQEGAIFTRVFIIYGTGIFLFSLLFSGHFVRMTYFFFSAFDFIKFLFILFFSSMCIAYVPTIIYAFWCIKNPVRPKPVRMQFAFLIYCICLFLFAGFFIFGLYKHH